MAESIPCPYCGSANDPSAANCHVCQYRLTTVSNPAADRKCPRCGSQVPGQFDFCPVCGLDQRIRLPRPSTQAMSVQDTYGDEAPTRPSQQVTAPPDGSHMAPGPQPGPQPGPAPAGPAMAPTMQPTGPGQPNPAGGHAMPRPAPLAHTAAPGAQGYPPAPAQPQPQYPSQSHPPQSQGYPPPNQQSPGGYPPTPAAPPAGYPPAQPPSPPPAAYPPQPQPGPAPYGGQPAQSPPAQAGYPSPQAQAGYPSQQAQAGYPSRQAQAPSGYPPSPQGVPPPGSGPAPTGSRLRMVLVGRDGSEGQSFPLAGAQMHIGRTQGEIRFAQDQFVSPMHARLIAVSGGVQVVDLGSRNGVFVRIASAEPVYPGDLFLLGHQLLRLENLPPRVDESATDADGVRGFGTPLEPAWGRISLVGVGDAVADSYCLRGTQVVFGRESGDVLFPHDAFLSRQHARIRMELRDTSMSVMLEDLRSANGTYLRMRGQAVLHPGDMFRVGDQILRVRND